MKKVRWGVLSTAGIAQESLLPAFMRAENAVVKAIATGSDVQKANRIAQEFNIETVYDSYEKLLNDREIDAVYIPLPNHLHKEWVVQAAEKGKHILCEKPAAINYEEAIMMVDACEKNDVLFMEAFMYSFHPQHSRVKEIIASGAIGEISYMTASFSFYLGEERRASSIKMDSKKGGGSIYDVGCYGIHAIRHLLDMEPETVHVHGVIDEVYGIDTDAVGYLTFPNDVRATFDCSFNAAMRHEYCIHGTEGSIIVPRAFRPDNYGGEGVIHVEQGHVKTIEIVHGDQYCMQVEKFSQAILNDEKIVLNTSENTIQNMKVIDACYRSLALGKTEKLHLKN